MNLLKIILNIMIIMNGILCVIDFYRYYKCRERYNKWLPIIFLILVFVERII